MLVVGTLVNLVTGGTALATHVSGAPLWLTVLIFLLPLPLNVLLTLSVWRSAGPQAHGWAAVARGLSLVWLTLTLIV